MAEKIDNTDGHLDGTFWWITVPGRRGRVEPGALRKDRMYLCGDGDGVELTDIVVLRKMEPPFQSVGSGA